MLCLSGQLKYSFNWATAPHQNLAHLYMTCIPESLSEALQINLAVYIQTSLVHMGKATVDPTLWWIPQVSKQTKNPLVLRSKYYLVVTTFQYRVVKADHRSPGSWEIPDRKRLSTWPSNTVFPNLGQYLNWQFLYKGIRLSESRWNMTMQGTSQLTSRKGIQSRSAPFQEDLLFNLMV